MIFGIGFLGAFIFAIIKVSISCMFWFSKKPKDKQYVFKTCFPYYIIILFGLCVTAIIQCDLEPFAIYIFGSLYFLALLIWTFKMNKNQKSYKTINEDVEPENPNLP
ncbi:MAG: hypothetical protein V3U80_10855 [Flavobacteriaceae bacterium]